MEGLRIVTRAGRWFAFGLCLGALTLAILWAAGGWSVLYTRATGVYLVYPVPVSTLKPERGWELTFVGLGLSAAVAATCLVPGPRTILRSAPGLSAGDLVLAFAQASLGVLGFLLVGILSAGTHTLNSLAGLVAQALGLGATVPPLAQLVGGALAIGVLVCAALRRWASESTFRGRDRLLLAYAGVLWSLVPVLAFLPPHFVR